MKIVAVILAIILVVVLFIFFKSIIPENIQKIIGIILMTIWLQWIVKDAVKEALIEFKEKQL